MPTLFAYDHSTSTRGHQQYHELSQAIYKKEAAKVADERDMIILIWDSTAEVADAARLEEINKNLSAAGGTRPITVAEYITDNDFHDRLVLITDGQTNEYNVDLCTTKLGMEWKFSSCEIHLINTGGVVNMSVTCPFTRNAPHSINEYVDHSSKTLIVVTPEDLEAISLIKTIDTLAQFNQHSEAIERVVRARTMGTTGDPSLRDNILAMKKRIVAARSAECAKEQPVVDMVAAVQASAPNALELAQAVTNNYYATFNDDWSAAISRLVGMCEGSLRGAFDLSNVNAAIQSDRARRAAETKTVAISDVAQTDAPAGFECPITLDTEADVVLLVAHEGAPVLTGLDKSVVNYLADCPLNALNNPEVVDRIKARLDHPVSLVALQQAAASGAPINASPMTARRIAGGIALGCNRDQVRCATSAIAQVVAGGKLLGNPDLWFAVIWRIVESGAVPHLAHLAPQFRAQMLWRCEHNSTFMALSGLPELPTTRVPLGVAAWYVVAASAFASAGREEPMRAHITHIEPLLAIVELAGYALPAGIPDHVLRLRTMLGMLSAVKKDRHTLPFIATALYQNTVPVDAACVGDAVRAVETVPPFVPVDGPATEASVALAVQALPEQWRALSPKELFALASMVDPSLSAGDVNVPFDFAPVAERRWTSAVTSWQYGLTRYQPANVQICPATCRPYYTVPASGQVWKEAASAHFGVPVEALLSDSRHFGEFVCKYTKYPTFDELIVYIYNRVVKGASGKTTLPYDMERLAKETMTDFAAVMLQVAPEDFRKRYASSRMTWDREKMEAAEKQQE